MADFKSRLKETIRKHKMTWIMVGVGVIIALLFLLNSYFFQSERALKWNLVFLFLYIISVAVWQIYSGVRYKEIIIPGTCGGGGAARKEKKPVRYFASLVLYIAMLIGSIYLLILLLKNLVSFPK